MTDEQIECFQDILKAQIKFADELNQLNQHNSEIQESIGKLKENIELLQNKLELEKLV